MANFFASFFARFAKPAKQDPYAQIGSTYSGLAPIAPIAVVVVAAPTPLPRVKDMNQDFGRGPSANFTWAEAQTTGTGIGNTLPDDLRANVINRSAPGMEKVRSILGDKPITVSSWYRSLAVNSAVGGVSNSAHLSGYAIDFWCPAYGSVYQVALELSKHKSELQYDQLICEGMAGNGQGGWVHIAFGPGARLQDMTMHSGAYTMGINP